MTDIISHETAMRTGLVNCGCECECTSLVHHTVQICGACEPTDPRRAATHVTKEIPTKWKTK